MSVHLRRLAGMSALLWSAFLPAADDLSGVLASAPLDRSASVQRLAFGSCFKVQKERDTIWSAITAQAPDLFVFAGDTLYPTVKHSMSDLPELRSGYAMLAENRAFAAFRDSTPVLPVWDDHDYGMNDGGADYQYRDASEQLFEDAWDLPADDPRRRRPGIYFSDYFGEPGQRLQLLVLDTRYFRSPLKKTDAHGARGRERYVPDADPAKTLLGEDQWRWLAEELKQPADLRIIVSSIQLLADGHGWEGWRQLPAERERLFALLRDHDSATTLVLSGDRHVAGFYEQDIGLREPLREFTSSALNNTIPFPYRRLTLAEDGPNREGDLYGGANFGTVEIDWDQRQVSLVLRDEKGESLRVETLKFRSRD